MFVFLSASRIIVKKIMLTVSVIELLGSVHIKRKQTGRRRRFEINVKGIKRNIKELALIWL